MSRAACKPRIVPVKFPAFDVTIFFKSIPIALNFLAATSVGLIKAARPDFKALALSEALIPPSLIAVRYRASS